MHSEKLPMKITPLKITCLSLLVWVSSALAAKDEAKLVGASNKNLKIMIRNIDDGEILWIGNYQLGTKASIKPGERKISAMCEFKYSWGTKIVPGEITINAEAGASYKISGSLSDDEATCQLSVGI
jgi:hypothetical protein